MENKDRDKVSRNTTSTSAGNVNRETSERMSHEKSGNAAEFGNRIGRAEDLTNEPSSRSSSSSGIGSSGSRSGSMESNSGSRSRSSSTGSDWQSSGSGRSSGSSSGYGDDDRTGSSSGRH